MRVRRSEIEKDRHRRFHRTAIHERVDILLTLLDKDIWVADHDFSLLGVNIGTRTTVVRLKGGGLFLHSPGPLDSGLSHEIDELGEVEYLVAPNKFHHLYLGDYMARWPAAKVYGAPGLAQKRMDLHFDGDLQDHPDSGWKDDLDQIWIEGAPKVNEIVFLHRPTQTLLLVDLVFSLKPSTFGMRIFSWLNGSQSLGTSRLMRLLLKDKEATKASVQKIFEWDFDRVIMSHGEIIEADGKSKLSSSFRWLLDG